MLARPRLRPLRSADDPRLLRRRARARARHVVAVRARARRDRRHDRVHHALVRDDLPPRTLGARGHRHRLRDARASAASAPTRGTSTSGKITFALRDGKDGVLDEIRQKKALIESGKGTFLGYWGVYFDCFQVLLYEVRPTNGDAVARHPRARERPAVPPLRVAPLASSPSTTASASSTSASSPGSSSSRSSSRSATRSSCGSRRWSSRASSCARTPPLRTASALREHA